MTGECILKLVNDDAGTFGFRNKFDSRMEFSEAEVIILLSTKNCA